MSWKAGVERSTSKSAAILSTFRLIPSIYLTFCAQVGIVNYLISKSLATIWPACAHRQSRSKAARLVDEEEREPKIFCRSRVSQRDPAFSCPKHSLPSLASRECELERPPASFYLAQGCYLHVSLSGLLQLAPRCYFQRALWTCAAIKPMPIFLYQPCPNRIIMDVFLLL